MQATDDADDAEDAVAMGNGSIIISLLDQYRARAAASTSSSNVVALEIQVYEELKPGLSLLNQQLSQHAHQRRSLVDSGLFGKVVAALGSLYATFQQVQAARPPPHNDVEENPGGDVSSVQFKEHQSDPYYRISHIATLCMRLLRNGLAGCNEAQNLLSQRFQLLAPFVANITRFHTLNDPDTLLLSRAAVQMLSNLITANRKVQHQMWPRIVATDKDDDRLVLKFLSAPDTSTQGAAQILLINFLRTPAWAEDAYERCFQLCTLPAGLALIESLLSSSESIMLQAASTTRNRADSEHEPDSDLEGLDESLGFIYTIFAILFEAGFASLLVSGLAPIEEISSPSTASMPAETPIITSSQLTLLKLLDSWLHANQKQVAESSSSPVQERTSAPTMRLGPAAARSGRGERSTSDTGLTGLVDIFIQLSAFARSAMSHGIAKDGVSADEQPQDRRLIGVHHGLLLLLQSLLSISMTADGWSEELPPYTDSETKDDQSFARLSRALLSDMRSNEAFVEELVALLDQTHQYAPALSPFRPAEARSADAPVEAVDTRATDRPLPQGHALSATGRAAHESSATQPSYGFDHLKRDIVRVLGSLVYAPTRSAPDGQERHDVGGAANISAHTEKQIRQVQDRVREKGGLFHVLNMTVLDERNPCKFDYGGPAAGHIFVWC